jgi:ATP synthase F1 epsilon subunit
MKFKVKIISKSRQLIDDEFDKVSIPSATGEMEILADHKPLVSEIKTGEIILHNGGESSRVIIYKGHLIFKDNLLQIAADEAEVPETLIRTEIEAAIKLAESRITDPNINPSELVQLEKKLMYERFKLGYIQD